MSEPEKFLDRWSRRKREAADEPAPAKAKDVAETRAESLPPDQTKAAEGSFDPASLPPIESIAADSDIRAFLKPDVPPELARAALRRAWSADPAIRDFIGLVENGWDFNDPHGVPGFGPLPVGEDIDRLLAQAIGVPQPVEPPPLQQSKPAREDSEQNRSQAIGFEPTQPNDKPAPNQDIMAPEREMTPRNVNVATQNNSDNWEDIPPSRQHGRGGALPK